MNRTAFRSLGRSGLIVSPYGLGTMTFGAPGWGASDDNAKRIFDAYIDAGGNFIDTADVYADGRSEELLGSFIAERKLRDRIVLATKYTFNAEIGNPNAGGNGRKNLHRALDASLRRLQTDYVDLYYPHFWDMVTPFEEVLQSLGDLVRVGKIRYFGFSDLPAWYAAAAAAYASAHAIPGPVVMQLEYSLVNRAIEHEHVAAAKAFGLGICPWGPLASGFLTGKYARSGDAPSGEGRFAQQAPFRTFTQKAWSALDAVRTVATQLGRPASQVALAWVATRPGVSSVLLGARSLEQLRDNVSSLAIELTVDQIRLLDESSAPEPGEFFSSDVKRMIFGGADVESWS